MNAICGRECGIWPADSTGLIPDSQECVLGVVRSGWHKTGYRKQFCARLVRDTCVFYRAMAWIGLS